MGVGGIGRGGGRGRAGGPKGAGGAGGASGAGKAGGAGKASGAGFGGRVDKSEGLVGPSGAAGSANVGAADAVMAHAVEIGAQLRSGQIKTREEATKRLVRDILKEKLRVKSDKLSQKISEQLLDDPRLSQTLDRIWSKS